MALPSLKGYGGMTIGTIIPPNRALDSIAETADCRVPGAVVLIGITVGDHRFCFGWILNRLWRRVIHQWRNRTALSFGFLRDEIEAKHEKCAAHEQCGSDFHVENSHSALAGAKGFGFVARGMFATE